MHFQLFTLFPEMFPGTLGHSLAGKALEKKIWSFETIDIRDYAQDKHKSVDDTPYGGGAGMVLKPDVIARALRACWSPETTLIYPSPRGALFSQSQALKLAEKKNVAMLCGRFEGLDERVIEAFPIQEISLGDYILSGGELPALAIMDACIRLLPGVVGAEQSLAEESFSTSSQYAHLLEYPLYTRPAQWEGKSVPEVLLSGNHAEIDRWRLAQAERLTQQRRSDKWASYLKSQTKNNP